MWEPVFPIVLMPNPQLELIATAMYQAGARLVEIGAWGGQHNYADPEATGKAAQTLRAAGLQPYSFHLSFGPRVDFSALDEGAIARAIDRLSPLLIIPSDRLDYVTDLVDCHDILSAIDKYLA